MIELAIPRIERSFSIWQYALVNISAPVLLNNLEGPSLTRNPSAIMVLPNESSEPLSSSSNFGIGHKVFKLTIICLHVMNKT